MLGDAGDAELPSLAAGASLQILAASPGAVG